jgi:chemotaxis signal transduction protein
VQVASANRTAKPMGMIVDGIEEVTQLSAAEIEFAPSFATDLHTEHILGMAKVQNTVKTLLNIDTLLDAEALKPNLAATVLETSSR